MQCAFTYSGHCSLYKYEYFENTFLFGGFIHYVNYVYDYHNTVQ